MICAQINSRDSDMEEKIESFPHKRSVIVGCNGDIVRVVKMVIMVRLTVEKRVVLMLLTMVMMMPVTVNVVSMVMVVIMVIKIVKVFDNGDKDGGENDDNGSNGVCNDDENDRQW